MTRTLQPQVTSTIMVMPETRDNLEIYKLLMVRGGRLRFLKEAPATSASAPQPPPQLLALQAVVTLRAMSISTSSPNTNSTASRCFPPPPLHSTPLLAFTLEQTLSQLQPPLLPASTTLL